MTERNDGRGAQDDEMGRKIKENLSGLGSFVPPAPTFTTIQSPVSRSLGQLGNSGARVRVSLKARPGLLVVGLIAVVALGSLGWRSVQTGAMDQSPAASEVTPMESGTPVAVVASPTADESALPSTDPETSVEASLAPTDAPEPSPSVIASPGDVQATAAAPWYADEVYMLKLINCTRTGGWVSTEGACVSDQGQHTLPAQPALVLDPEISARVARPYAKLLAERRVLDHYADHDPRWRLCNRGGFCGDSLGENLASPSATGAGGLIEVQIFYQNESFSGAGHYGNIMEPRFHRVGIGVWATSDCIRVVIDFYE